MKDTILEYLKEYINGYNDVRLSRLKSNNDMILCVGTGISASVNLALYGRNYLWNGLVYGIAGELLKEEFVDSSYIQALQKTDEESVRLGDSDEAKEKYIKFINEGINMLVKDESFLSSDNSMECVEYIKYMAFNNDDGKEYEDYAENLLALVTYDLFNGIRKSNPYAVENEIDREITKSYGSSDDDYKKYIDGHGETLIEVAELIKRMGSADVLTYNYDDYLETTLKKIYGKSEVVSIFDDLGDTDKGDKKIRIYHVHGYVPKSWDRLSKLGDFIFSENSYSHMTDEIYRWANRIQAETFSKNRILFVGFSGVDINFRRLMKEIRKEYLNTNTNTYEYPYHTMFMGYGSIINSICDSGFFSVVNSSETDFGKDLPAAIAANIVLQIIDAKDKYYKDQLGIELLWYNDFSEIADMLHKMQEK